MSTRADGDTASSVASATSTTSAGSPAPAVGQPGHVPTSRADRRRPSDEGTGLRGDRALVALAVLSALSFGAALALGSKPATALSLAVIIGAALVALVLSRFGWFLLGVLALRSATDILGPRASVGPVSPSMAVGVIFLVAGLVWLAALNRSGRARRVSLTSVGLGALVVMASLSALASTSLSSTLTDVLRLSTGALMFVVLEQFIRTDRQLRGVVLAIFASTVVPFVLTLGGLATGTATSEVKGDFTRLTGTFTQSNDFGRFLAIFVVLAVALLPYVHARLRTALVAVTVVGSALLLMTLTLGAIAATAAGVALIALLQRRAGLLVGMLTAGVLALLLSPGLADRLAQSQVDQVSAGSADGNSLEWRLRFWGDLLALANKHPLTGIGFNTTQLVVPDAKQPHNDYLGMYLETGVFGLLAYLVVIGSLVALCVSAVRRAPRGTFDHAVAVGALAVTLGFAVQSLAANVISNMAIVWYVFAAAACAGYVRQKYAPGAAPKITNR